MKKIDFNSIKSFIIANALNGKNVMLMLHPSSFNKLIKAGKGAAKSLCISGINIIADNNNEISEGEIDILEVNFN